jgi:hypothetical protein
VISTNDISELSIFDPEVKCLKEGLISLQVGTPSARNVQPGT